MVDVVLANESVGVLLRVVDTLNLDGCVEQVVLASTEVCYCSECFQGLTALDVGSHGQLTNGK